MTRDAELALFWLSVEACGKAGSRDFAHQPLTKKNDEKENCTYPCFRRGYFRAVFDGGLRDYGRSRTRRRKSRRIDRRRRELISRAAPDSFVAEARAVRSEPAVERQKESGDDGEGESEFDREGDEAADDRAETGASGLAEISAAGKFHHENPDDRAEDQARKIEENCPENASDDPAERALPGGAEFAGSPIGEEVIEGLGEKGDAGGDPEKGPGNGGFRGHHFVDHDAEPDDDVSGEDREEGAGQAYDEQKNRDEKCQVGDGHGRR